MGKNYWNGPSLRQPHRPRKSRKNPFTQQRSPNLYRQRQRSLTPRRLRAFLRLLALKVKDIVFLTRYAAHIVLFVVALTGSFIHGTDLDDVLQLVPNSVEARVADATLWQTNRQAEDVYLTWDNLPVSIINEQPAVARSQPISYEVQEGDNPELIAERFGLSPLTVVWANTEFEENPYLLQLGQTLLIPPVDGVLHTVQLGDSVQSIAAAYQVDARTIVDYSANELSTSAEEDTLVSGQQLVVPGGMKALPNPEQGQAIAAQNEPPSSLSDFAGQELENTETTSDVAQTPTPSEDQNQDQNQDQALALAPAQGATSTLIAISTSTTVLAPVEATQLPFSTATPPITSPVEPTAREVQATSTLLVATATRIPPTATRIRPTSTRIPPTVTRVLPTATRVPPTSTRVQSTLTSFEPTWTSVPPTWTRVPPTSTRVPPTFTAVPTRVARPAATFTFTPIPPTWTRVPPTATFVPPTQTTIPSATAIPTSTPIPSLTPEPTWTLEPTWTPVPSWTPEPTWTPVPTWTPLPTATPIIYLCCGWPMSGRITTQPSSWHMALDIVGPYGTSIKSAGTGYVIAAGWDNSGYGYRVMVDHGGGITTLYAHLSSFSVSYGDFVGQGQIIGQLGSSGRSTGPHLHFEVRQYGYRQNPYSWLP